MLLKTTLTYTSNSSVFYRVVTCTIVLLLPAIASFFFSHSNWAATVSAQSVSVNNAAAAPHSSAMLDVSAANKGLLIPRVDLTATTDVVTITTPAVSLLVYNRATAGIYPDNVVPGYYYWNGSKWNAFAGQATSTIAFSTGNILQGATVVSSSPVLMGFGNSSVAVIDGSGEMTMPPQGGGFSFAVPISGTIKNLQVSADLLVSSISSINVVGLQYDFTVFVSPSPQNNGMAAIASPYLTTALTSSLRFGFPNFVAPGMYYSATNLNTGALAVNAGDRIGIRIRTQQGTDMSASDITQLSFNASLTYTAAQ